MMTLTFRLLGVQESLDELRDACDGGMNVAALHGMQWVTDDARATHAFQNRTGWLEASIQQGEVSGTFSRGDLEFTVSAEAEYASYVEASRCRGKDTEDVRSPGPYAYLGPAFEHQEDRIDAEIQRQLNASARAAGWSVR